MHMIVNYPRISNITVHGNPDTIKQSKSYGEQQYLNACLHFLSKSKAYGIPYPPRVSWWSVISIWLQALVELSVQEKITGNLHCNKIKETWKAQRCDRTLTIQIVKILSYELSVLPQWSVKILLMVQSGLNLYWLEGTWNASWNSDGERSNK